MRAPAAMGSWMMAHSLRKDGLAAGFIQTMRCSFVFTGTVDVLPPRYCGTELKLVGRYEPYRCVLS